MTTVAELADDASVVRKLLLLLLWGTVEARRGHHMAD